MKIYYYSHMSSYVRHPLNNNFKRAGVKSALSVKGIIDEKKSNLSFM